MFVFIVICRSVRLRCVGWLMLILLVFLFGILMGEFLMLMRFLGVFLVIVVMS